MNDLYTKQGFVYVLTHESMPGICKIGATRKHPIQRARELASSTGVPGPYTLSYYRDFVDSFKAETLLHKRLDEYRVNESREFFQVDVGSAVRAVDDVSKQLHSEGIRGGSYGRPVETVATPWAELFASFKASDSNELNEEEIAQCRALRSKQQEGRLSRV